MTNYIIEGNVDFYHELYNSLDIQDEYNNDNDNLCLITNQPLTENFIKMECGHKFNYLPLFNDIKNHKQKFNGMEGSSSKLNMNEIRCPYCRKKQMGILPYYEELELGKITGVNYINPNYKDNTSCCRYKRCEFLTPNPNYCAQGINPLESSPYPTSNCKFFTCNQTYALQINNGIVDVENYGDEKFYCWSHKKKMIKKYKKEILDKQKESIKNEKLKIKDELKKAKEEEKQKEKEEKQKAKEELKEKMKEDKNQIKKEKEVKKKYKKETKINSIKKDDNDSENIIIGPINIIVNDGENDLCMEILKSGIKKGLQCSSTKFKDNLCKRHFNLKNKIKE
jgi:hypothetical protein